MFDRPIKDLHQRLAMGLQSSEHDGTSVLETCPFGFGLSAPFVGMVQSSVSDVNEKLSICIQETREKNKTAT